MPTTVYHDSTLSFLPPQWNVNQEYFSFPAGNSSSPGSSSSESSASSSCHEDSRSPLRSPDTTTLEDVSSAYLGGDKPYLQILEEPHEKYRFRYRTEMQGTHGALLGAMSNLVKRKTYPRVKLCHYKGDPRDPDPIIRCTLYTADTDYSKRVPHVHRLVCKEITGTRQESDDPYDIVVRAPNYTANFQHMTILFTKKEEQMDVLILKKRNHAKRRFTDGRTLKTLNTELLRAAAAEDLSTMNLNIASLRFEALIEKNGQYVSLCAPIYSKTICNMKHTKTNELRICRVDKYRGCCDGKEEIFIFVEKVSKKDIKVKFYEEDDNGIITWTAYADFNPENDVHHQFGIVFNTPPYKDPNITQNVSVYFQLERPSDKAVSAPIAFDYTPNKDRLRNLNRKRPKRDDCTLPTTVRDLQPQSAKIQVVPVVPVTAQPIVSHSDDLSKLLDCSALPSECLDDSLLMELGLFSGGMDNNTLPEVATEERIASSSSNISFNQLLETLPSTDSEVMSQVMSFDRFEEYAQLWGQEEGAAQWKEVMGSVPQVAPYNSDLGFDGVCRVATEQSNDIKDDQEDSLHAFGKIQPQMFPAVNLHSVKRKAVFKLTENNIVESIERTINNLIKLKHSRKLTENKMQECLVQLFTLTVGDLDDSVLHILAAIDGLPVPSQATKFLNVLKMYEVNREVINVENARRETPLHVAASRGSPQMISLLLDAGANINATEELNNTACHLAILRDSKALDAVGALLRKLPDLSIANEDGFTVLHLAVKQRKSDIISSLLIKSEDHYSLDPINETDRKNGNTALHIAVQCRFKEVVNLLLNFEERIDINKKNFAGKTPLSFVFEETDVDSRKIKEILISNKADPELVELTKKEDCKDEQDSDEENDVPDESQDIDEGQSAYAREWVDTELFDKPTISKLCPLLDEHGDWEELIRRLKYRQSEIEFCRVQCWSPSLLAFKLAADYKPEITAETIRDELLTMAPRLRRGVQYIDDMLLHKLGLI